MMTDRIYKERFFRTSSSPTRTGRPVRTNKARPSGRCCSTPSPSGVVYRRSALKTWRRPPACGAPRRRRGRGPERRRSAPARWCYVDDIERVAADDGRRSRTARRPRGSYQGEEESGRARVCDFCNKRSETKLRACGKCKFVFYCDAGVPAARVADAQARPRGARSTALCLALERNAPTIDTQHAASRWRTRPTTRAARRALTTRPKPRAPGATR